MKHRAFLLALITLSAGVFAADKPGPNDYTKLKTLQFM